jgi:predicted MFS family arabinose efflux permease
VSYIFSVASLLAIRHPEQAPEPRAGSALAGLLADTKEGWRFVTRHPMLRKIAACTGTSNLTGDLGFAVITVFMVRSLHMSPARIGLVFAIGSVAGLVGALIARRVIDRIGVGPTIIASAIVTSLGGLAIPLASPGAGVTWIVVGFAIFWVGAVTYNVAQVSLRQAITPAAMLGRMNATMRFMVWGPMPIGALIGGALGQTIGLRSTLWVSAIGSLFAPLWVIFSPVRRQHEIPALDVARPTLEPSPAGPVLEP